MHRELFHGRTRATAVKGSTKNGEHVGGFYWVHFQSSGEQFRERERKGGRERGGGGGIGRKGERDGEKFTSVIVM